jgi:pimeloyl-ACP methyl ester carboxylesterase
VHLQQLAPHKSHRSWHVGTHSARFSAAATAVAAVTAVAAALAVPVAQAGQATPEVPAAQTFPAASDITWEDCPDQVTNTRAECGRIDVPMYHADPDGEQISVGFVRVAASNPEAKRGTLFGNPGGPGADAYEFFGYDGEYSMQWPDELSSEWDMVAVQPRGLPGSTPVDCENEPAGWDPVRIQTQNGGYTQAACEVGTPGYTNALNTWETARDWEDVRAALGEEKISILGLSYGTQLGSTYASTFPERTDKLVLDSGYDTDRAWAGLLDDQTGGYTGALHDFLAWTAERDDTYGLGDTPLAVYRSWSAKIVAESGTNPTAVPPPAEIGDLPPGLQWGGQPAADVLSAIGHPQAQIENVFRMMATPGANQSTSETLGVTRSLLPQPNQWGLLAEIINGTESMSSIPGASQEESPDPDQAESEMFTYVAMQSLVICAENQVAPDYTRIPGAIWSGTVTGDIFSAPGDMAASGISCAGREPDAPWTDITGSELETAPLQLQGTSDPQTVYRTHQPMADAMGSHVITVDGPGHGQFGMGNEVVDNAVLEYLRDGRTDVTSAPSRPVE